MGSNPASNHPIAFKWITKAMEKGAKVICVDPRFTQSAAKAHLYAPLRSGTDIAFLGGMIKYILDNKLYFEEYVKLYTNATFLVNPDFKLPGDNKGVFSGLTGAKYDKATWSYQTDASGVIKKDPSMTDPALRLPAPEETLFPIHHRDGQQNYGNARSQARGDLQTLRFNGQAGQER